VEKKAKTKFELEMELAQATKKSKQE